MLPSGEGDGGFPAEFCLACCWGWASVKLGGGARGGDESEAAAGVVVGGRVVGGRGEEGGAARYVGGQGGRGAGI